MSGLIWFLLFLLLFTFAGIGPLRWLGLGRFWVLAPVFGSPFIIGIFSGTLLITKSATISTIAAVVTTLAFFFTGLRKTATQLVVPSRYENLILLSLFAITVLFAGNQLLDSDIRYYWGSGNPDVTDGANGVAHFYRTTMDLEKTHPFSTFSIDQEFESLSIRTQYVSAMFFTLIMGPSPSVGNEELQNLWFCGLTLLALYFLFRFGFGSTACVAIVSALLSTLSILHISSFHHGHMGSLMSDATLPVLLAIALPNGYKLIRSRSNYLFLLLFAPIFFMYATSYPFTFPLTAVPVLFAIFIQAKGPGIYKALRAKSRAFQFSLTTGLIVTTCTALAILFQISEPMRVRASSHARAMSFFFTTDLFHYISGFKPIIYSPENSHLIIFATAVFFAIFAFSLIRIVLNHDFKNTRIFWISLWIQLLMLGGLLTYFVTDSYFFYKFIYTNHYWIMFFIVTVVFADSLHRYLRRSMVFLLLLVLIGNIDSISKNERFTISHNKKTGKVYADWSEIKGRFKNLFVPSTEQNFSFFKKYYLFKDTENYSHYIESAPAKIAKLNGFTNTSYQDPFKIIYPIDGRPFFDVLHYPVATVSDQSIEILSTARLQIYNATGFNTFSFKASLTGTDKVLDITVDGQTFKETLDLNQQLVTLSLPDKSKKVVQISISGKNAVLSNFKFN